jgi:hypothetical protein
MLLRLQDLHLNFYLLALSNAKIAVEFDRPAVHPATNGLGCH